MKYIIHITLLLLLTGCSSFNPFSFSTAGETTLSQKPTQGGDATVKIYADRTEIELNQPENTEDKSSIKLSGVPVVTGQDKDGKPLIERSELEVVVGGTTPLLFDKVKGIGGGTMASNIGYGAIILGLILIIARFVPALAIFIHTWMLGAGVMASGFAIIVVDKFLAQYGTISCFILIVVGGMWYAHRKGLITETPSFMKPKEDKEILFTNDKN